LCLKISDDKFYYKPATGLKIKPAIPFPSPAVAPLNPFSLAPVIFSIEVYQIIFLVTFHWLGDESN